ncbi:MAG: preprotein translocase subunit SecG [Clostridia bacterium]|nr:preprotein translocase subunit SecG [Clostridia bacterium]MCR5693701.1 preprotein translocase subunit SecG [Clostridia bacterium]
MSLVLKIVLGILYILVCIATVIITLLQESKESGVSALGGVETSMFDKKNGTKEAFLARATVALGIIFALFAIALTIVYRLV